MVNEIFGMSSARTPAMNAWIYVAENTHGGRWRLTESNWQHHPEIFINSIGFGWCDDRASVLAALWKAMGYQSQIWSLQGHVVPEVNDGSGWQVFDPEMNCYFVNENNKVASYHDLASSAALVLYLYHPVNSVKYLFEEDNFNRLSKTEYEQWLRAYYTTRDDNQDVTQWHLAFQKHISDKIVLPHLSELDFIQMPDYHFEEVLPVKNLIKITLFPGAKGILYLPLVPVGCSGNFTYAKAGKKISVAGVSAFDYNSCPVDSFMINSVKDTSVVCFLANGVKASGDFNELRQSAYDASLSAIIASASKGERLN